MSHSDAATHPPAPPLPPRLPIVGTPPDCVPARMINEVLYCERLCYLEWVQGEFEHNVYTLDGKLVHDRPDQPGGQMPPALDADLPLVDRPDDEDLPYKARSVWLTSEKLGMTAKIDVVEGSVAGRVVPIEYKRGQVPDVPEGAFLPERAQLCAQVMLLREHGYRCDEAAIYFAGSNRRVAIAIDDALIATTTQAVARIRDMATKGQIPPPLVDSPKCHGCSLIGICLPDETNLLRRLAGDHPLDLAPVAADEGGIDARQGAAGEPEAVYDDDDGEEALTDLPAIRRLVPASDDKMPLYVQDQGARVSLNAERLIVTAQDGTRTEARMPHTSQVAIFGSVQVTTQALRALIERGIPLTLFTAGGYFIGRALGLESKNIELRIAQHRAASDPAFCLELAKRMVTSKVKNSRTFLRRNHGSPDPTVLSELDRVIRKVDSAPSLESLLGLEGTAARAYFSAFTGMFKGSEDVKKTFDWNGRNRRPPRDPINALLSLVYALLTKELTIVLTAVGLDPLLGFYHQPRFGRPALSLDLMEEFRPLVADSVVVTIINSGTVDAADFVMGPGSAAIKAYARKKVLQAYERRMNQEVTHPIFGYKLSYRRVLEVQARLLGRVLLGEIEAYPTFNTR